MARDRLRAPWDLQKDDDEFDPDTDVPSHSSISQRRKVSVGLRVPTETHDSFRVTDTSYTRHDIKIDHKGLKSTECAKTHNGDDGEEKKQSSLIQDISEIKLFDALGSGASGYVVQAVHVPSGKRLAIKTIDIYAKSKRHQIMNEIAALDNNTQSNGLVMSYGTFFSQGSVLIALEYCECGSLCDIRKKVGRIPEEALAIFCINILKGLAVLHNEKKQVHRDLKPSNIVVNAKGEAKITDFGISRELDNTIGKCRSYVGTYTYMSPERIRAEPYSFTSDIWAIGLTLFECAIGAFPYPHIEFPFEMIQYILSEPAPQFPTTMKFTAHFKDFIYKCICKDPMKRPSATDLMEHEWITLNKQYSQFDIKKWILDNKLIIKHPLDDDTL